MVFGNLSTGYWLGAAAAAGLHWIELGRKTLTGAVETIAAGYDSKNLTVTGTDTFTTSGGSAWANWVHGQPVTAGTIIEFTVDDTSTNVFVGFGTGTGTDSLAAGAPVKNCVYLTAGGDIFWSDSTGTDNDTGSNRASGDTYKLDWESGGDIKLYVKASGGSYGSALKTWSSVSGTLYPMIQGYSGIVVTTTSNSTANLFTLPTKPYMMVLFHDIPTGTTQSTHYFNGDTGSNYASRESYNGGTDSTITSIAYGRLPATSITTDYDEPKFHVAKILNVADQEKLTITHSVSQEADGAGTAPNRAEIVGKWANTADSITSVKMTNIETGSYNTGSECVVLGYDPDDTEGTSVWEELANVTTSTAGDVDTGTFTAKKYLWVQINSLGNGDVNNRMRFNNDSSGNYAYRVSGNGGSDSTSTTPSGIPFGNGNSVSPDNAFDNFFIINTAAQEKLITGHTITDEGTGAGNAPQRNEIVAKWANTSNQITRINLVNVGSGNHSAGSKITVWGFD